MTYRLDDLHRDGAPPLPRPWDEHRGRIEQVWSEIAGHGEHRPGEATLEVISSIDRGSHTEAEVVVTVPGDTIPAALLTPNGQDGPSPAVVALHPTNPAGKWSVAGVDGPVNRGYGIELAQRGYVVLAPDTITAGDRIVEPDKAFHTARHDQTHPELSAVGKMINDHRHAVDVLSSLDSVDPTRIGAIGHSLGGYNAFFLAGADERIAAVVASCGFASFAGDEALHRWGQRDWFSHLPRLSPLLDDGTVPFEMHEIAALMAPRPLFVWMGTEDRIFPHWAPSWDAVRHLGRLYDDLDAADRFTAMLGHGGHDFPPDARTAAYAFLDRQLDVQPKGSPQT